MAVLIDDTPQTIREERIHTPASDSAQTPSFRPPLETRYSDGVVLAIGPCVRWGGLLAGVVTAVAVILLLTTLGIVVGLSTFDSSLFANSAAAKNLATTTGIWTAVSTLIAYFVAGLVATKVTDRPDGGALLHGVLAWMLLSMSLSWLLTSGLLLSLGGLPGDMLLRMNRNAVSIDPRPLTDNDITQGLGLTDPSQLMSPASDERMVNVLAALTNMSREEAQAALDDLRARVGPLQHDPAAVEAEIRVFLSQMLARAQQQTPAVVANIKRQMERGWQMTLVMMVVTLVVTSVGARAGVPNSYRGRMPIMRRYGA